MAEDLKRLIEKIHTEGIKAGEDKAKEIGDEARRRADEIIGKAKKEAEKIIADARYEVARMEESSKASLRQAGRDVVIKLREEIVAILDRVVVSNVREALNPSELVKILTWLIKENMKNEKKDIVILLKDEDLEKVERTLFNAVGEELKKGITIKPSEDIKAGFIISYDKGKSYFEFTDKAIAEYIGVYVKPKLREILRNPLESVE